MENKRIFRLVHETARKNAVEHVKQAPDGYIVVVQPQTRSLEQNAHQWPILQEFSRQKQWAVNGKLETLSPDDWKDLLTAGFKNEMRMTQGVNGGVVMLGSRTSVMSKKVFADWLTYLYAMAAELGIELERLK